MDSESRAVLWWSIGVLMTADMTALPVLLFAMDAGYGIPSETLSGFVQVWLYISIVVAFVPALLIILGVADDTQMQEATKIGRQMAFYGNVIGLAVLLIVEFYRRVLKPSSLFWAILAVIVPTRYPKVPDRKVE